MRASLAVLVLLAVAGCGDDGAIDVDVAIDAAVDAATCRSTAGDSLCDPLAPRGQQGCNPGQKCSAATVVQDGLTCLRMTCVPDGLQGLDEACTWETRDYPTVFVRFDDCAAGLVCAEGDTCRDICGFGGGATERCARDVVCYPQPGLFSDGDETPFYGVCKGPPRVRGWWSYPPGGTVLHAPGP